MTRRTAMNRRDFLTFRRRGPERVLELSCERLYMRWADAHSGAGSLEAVGDARGIQWDGEPPTDIATSSAEALFGELERGLAQADRLRLLDLEWLSDAAFALDVEARVEAFRARGGRVE